MLGKVRTAVYVHHGPRALVVRCAIWVRFVADYVPKTIATLPRTAQLTTPVECIVLRLSDVPIGIQPLSLGVNIPRQQRLPRLSCACHPIIVAAATAHMLCEPLDFGPQFLEPSAEEISVL